MHRLKSLLVWLKLLLLTGNESFKREINIDRIRRGQGALLGTGACNLN